MGSVGSMELITTILLYILYFILGATGLVVAIAGLAMIWVMSLATIHDIIIYPIMEWWHERFH